MFDYVPFADTEKFGFANWTIQNGYVLNYYFIFILLYTGAINK